MSITQITSTVTPVAGKPQWGGNFKASFSQLIEDKENQGKPFEVSIKPVSLDAAYYQHKYYRGHLLKAIADESFDGIEAKAHWYFKDLFLKVQVSSWDEIPKKHQRGCTPIHREFTREDGEVFTRIVAYIPSTADLTRKEFKEYIEKIERFVADLQLHFQNESEAAEYRRRGFSS